MNPERFQKVALKEATLIRLIDLELQCLHQSMDDSDLVPEPELDLQTGLFLLDIVREALNLTEPEHEDTITSCFLERHNHMGSTYKKTQAHEFWAWLEGYKIGIEEKLI